MVDLSRKIETMPIDVDPSINLSVVTDFVYVRYNIPGPRLERSMFEEVFEGCGCDGKSFCNDSCVCISRFGKVYDDARRLVAVDPFSVKMKPIYECNKRCKCHKTCHNRVVQHGIHTELCVFKTDTRGYGVRCKKEITKNTFICEYAGEVLTLETARLRTANLRRLDPNYILTLTEHTSEGVMRTHVDPTFIGNVGRFVNHSCEPNLYMVPVRVNRDVPHLALFALRNLEAGEELTYDYSGVVHSADNNMKEDTAHDNSEMIERTHCLCGSVQCRGYLPYHEVLFTNAAESK